MNGRRHIAILIDTHEVGRERGEELPICEEAFWVGSSGYIDYLQSCPLPREANKVLWQLM